MSRADWTGFFFRVLFFIPFQRAIVPPFLSIISLAKCFWRTKHRGCRNLSEAIQGNDNRLGQLQGSGRDLKGSELRAIDGTSLHETEDID